MRGQDESRHAKRSHGRADSEQTGSTSEISRHVSRNQRPYHLSGKQVCYINLSEWRKVGGKRKLKKLQIGAETADYSWSLAVSRHFTFLSETIRYEDRHVMFHWQVNIDCNRVSVIVIKEENYTQCAMDEFIKGG